MIGGVSGGVSGGTVGAIGDTSDGTFGVVSGCVLYFSKDSGTGNGS